MKRALYEIVEAIDWAVYEHPAAMSVVGGALILAAIVATGYIEAL